PAAGPPGAVHALELRQRAVLPCQLVQEPDCFLLVRRIEDGFEPRTQRADAIDVFRTQPLRGRLKPVPGEPVPNVRQPFDQIGLSLELVPGVDEIDGDGETRAASFVSCQWHTDLKVLTEPGVGMTASTSGQACGKRVGDVPAIVVADGRSLRSAPQPARSPPDRPRARWTWGAAARRRRVSALSPEQRLWPPRRAGDTRDRARSPAALLPPHRRLSSSLARFRAARRRDCRDWLRGARAGRGHRALARPALGGVPDGDRDVAPAPVRAVRARAPSECLEGGWNRREPRDRRVPCLPAEAPGAEPAHARAEHSK